MKPEEERRRRAAERRRTAILRKSSLAEGEADLHPIRGPEALSLVTRLTAESWSLSRRSFPEYSRQEIPCRFVQGARD